MSEEEPQQKTEFVYAQPDQRHIAEIPVLVLKKTREAPGTTVENIEIIAKGWSMQDCVDGMEYVFGKFETLRKKE